jgi:hypothetical protein
VQTFLPYSDFSKSANCLDDRRLGKQRVEGYQILKSLSIGPYQRFHKDAWVACDERTYNSLKSLKVKKLVRKTPWYNHPATKMWAGSEGSLKEYTVTVCSVWTSRGFKDTITDKLNSVPNSSIKSKTPSWIGDESFHAAHRSNLLRKNKVWYSKFNWKESDDLPYVWPK